MRKISAENAYIFRITHNENLPWLLLNGVHCRNSNARDPSFQEIGNADLISKRAHRTVPVGPGGTLSDYVPFYFTPSSPMLYNIKTGYNGIKQTPMPRIVILVSSLHKVAEDGVPFVFTDRHAYLQAAEFKSDLNDLNMIDWQLLANRDFKRDPNDPGKVERYQAEALIYQCLPISTLLGIACYDSGAEAIASGYLEECGVSLKIVVQPGWYF